jgi:hypothetical protein
MASGTPVPADTLEFTHDAALLAVRLRALALMLCLMLAQAALPGAAGPRAGRLPDGLSGWGFRRLDASPAPDTS